MSKTVSGLDLESGYADHPQHTVATTPAQAQVRVWLGDSLIAESDRALALHEADYPAVYYLPRSDVDMSSMARSDHKTWCPFKGQASYYSISLNNSHESDAVWSYEDPFTEIGEIKDYLAFYPNKFRIESGNS